MTKHNTIQSRTFRVLPLTAAALVICAAGFAAAQSGEGGQSGGKWEEFSKPLNKKSRSSTSNQTTMMASASDGQNTYSLRIEGDEISAEVNGKPVPQERIRRQGDTVELLDKKGDVLHTFRVGTMPAGRTGAWAGGFGQPPVAPVAPVPPVPPVAEEPPPVMLGLLMNDNAEEGAIEVVEVFPDMPAAKAGLKKGDMIIKLDNRIVESSADLRDVIRTKKGGESLELVVERDGARKTLTVALVAYDADAMAKARAAATGVQPNEDVLRIPGFPGALTMNEDWSAQARKAIEKAMAELKAEGIDTNKLKADVQKSLEQALAAIEKSSGEWRMKVQNWGQSDAEESARIWVEPRQGQGRAFVVPRGGMGAAAAPRAAETNDKLDRLADQLERLNKRLADLEKKLAEHKQP